MSGIQLHNPPCAFIPPGRSCRKILRQLTHLLCSYPNSKEYLINDLTNINTEVHFMSLDDVLKNSSYNILEGLYSMAKVGKSFNYDDCFLITRDEIESTVIYEQSKHCEGIIEEKRDYLLIGINVAVPFNSPGFIAKISSAFASRGISVLVISTYSRDYFMVNNQFTKEVNIILDELGIKKFAKEV